MYNIAVSGLTIIVLNDEFPLVDAVELEFEFMIVGALALAQLIKLLNEPDSVTLHRYLQQLSQVNIAQKLQEFLQ